MGTNELLSNSIQPIHEHYSGVSLTLLPLSADDARKARFQWLQIQHGFQSIAAQVSATRNSLEGPSKNTQILSELQSWRLSLPGKYSDIGEICPREIARDGKKFWLFCRYHEIKIRLRTDDLQPIFLRETFRDAQIVLRTVSMVPDSFILADPYVTRVLSRGVL